MVRLKVTIVYFSVCCFVLQEEDYSVVESSSLVLRPQTRSAMHINTERVAFAESHIFHFSPLLHLPIRSKYLQKQMTDPQCQLMQHEECKLVSILNIC